MVEEVKIAPLEKITEKKQQKLLGHLYRMKYDRIAKEIYEANT